MTTLSHAEIVTAKDLQKAVSDLQVTGPGPGLQKTLVSAVTTLPLIYLALTAESTPAFLGLTVVAAFCYASWLITTHDAIHHTLTGWAWFDELVPRLISYPFMWVHGMYADVHKLHHKMNGDDFRDPERIQWTHEEYQAAGSVGRWYVRHQWAVDIFFFGGIGLILDTARQAFKAAKVSKTTRKQIALDLGCIAVLQVLIYSYATAHGGMLHYLVFWIIAERIGGGVLQFRAHVEHYGLWGKGRHYFETQAYNCRNLDTSGFASWFFNRLNYHSVHHAFPRVPFYALAAAHQRFQDLYGKPGIEPLVQDRSYLATSLRLAGKPVVIGGIDPASRTGRRVMVSV